MSERPALDLVMPVYQEGANIARALDEIRLRIMLPKRVMIIYDLDDDDTIPAVEAWMADRECSWVELIKNHHGRGVLGAIRTGLDQATADVVLITMADLSDDLSCVPAMVEQIRDLGADVVCASRYMEGGRQIGGPRLKRWLSRTAGVSLFWLAGWPIHDATNAFRAYRGSFLKETPIESTAGFAYSLELTAKAIDRGKRVVEVPSTWRDRSAGRSRFRLLAWMPHYLRWYVWALDRSRRAGILAGLAMVILAIIAGSVVSSSFVKIAIVAGCALILYALSRLVMGLAGGMILTSIGIVAMLILA